MLANLFGKIEYKQFKTKLHLLFQIYYIRTYPSNEKTTYLILPCPSRTIGPELRLSVQKIQMYFILRRYVSRIFCFEDCPVIRLQIQMSKLHFRVSKKENFIYIFYCPFTKLPLKKHVLNTLFMPTVGQANADSMKINKAFCPPLKRFQSSRKETRRSIIARCGVFSYNETVLQLIEHIVATWDNMNKPWEHNSRLQKINRVWFHL